MYGLSDHPNGMPWTRFSAERQGSSRYSTRIPVAKLIEHTFAVPTEVEPGILRVTLPLPSGPRHVHSFLLRGDDGWTLVDTGLGLAEPSWEDILAQVDGPVTRIFITHMHPDHVGGAEAAVRATGAEVLQGRLDYSQCERVWGSTDWPERIADRVRARVRGLRPLRVEPDARRAGRRARWLAHRRHARARRRASLSAPGRRARRRRHAARADHACDRALSREPPRSARGLHRDAGRDRGARPAGLLRRPRRDHPRAGSARPRDRCAPRRPARPDRSRPRRGAAHRLRRVARSVRLDAPAHPAAFRRRRGAVAPRAARRARARA